MMKRFVKHLFLCLSVLTAASCIENDLSFPNVVADFTSFEVEGQKSVTIDNDSRTIDILMGENADMKKVKVLNYTVSNDAEIVGGMPEYLDLTDSLNFTLRVYEDFVWTVKAAQPIERYIRCDNQVGEARIDAEEKAAYVYVSENQSLADVRFNEMKLEPEGSVIARTLGFIPDGNGSVPETLDCIFPMVLDCVIMRYFFVEYDGKEIRWSVKVLQKAAEVELQSVNPWACFAGVRGITDGKGTPVIEYRKASDSEWIEYPEISVSGNNVTAELRGLEPQMDYVVRLGNGELFSNEVAFTTEAAAQLENFSFDDWYMSGKAWMPNLDSNVQIWDTANPGSAAIGVSPTTPETEIVVNGKAARMETQMANVLGIKKMAAGNIYTGKFGKIAGLGAELDWGVPFGARPLALRGYYKYSPQAINVADDKDYKDKIGQMDECQIQIFLAEWTKPFHVNSSKKEFVDQKDKSIIAFSEFCTSETTPEYKHFTLPIVYNDNRIPTYVVISGCASRYGNFFTGGIGSLLYIDEFELVYDPDELTDEEYAMVFSKVKPI